jgi:hypothetical protein
LAMQCDISKFNADTQTPFAFKYYQDYTNTRTVILPQCVVDGVNYQRCNPATALSKDQKTCKSIKDEACGKKSKSNRADASYCACIGLEDKSEMVQLRGAINAPF